ncbi:MAG: ATP-binding protein [Candidatus Omnitrophota bacterium]
MATPLRVLMVEDSENDAVLISHEIKRGGYDLYARRVQTAKDMREALMKEKWDLVISDYVMPAFDGLSAYRVLKETKLDLPFIVVSGSIGEDIAVDAMKAGVHDYIMKNNLTRLVPAIAREMKEAAVRWGQKMDELIIDELASYPQRYPNPIVEVEPNGVVHYMNPKAKQLFPAIMRDGFSHPFLSGLDVIWDELSHIANNVYEREIRVGDAFYHQAIYYIDDSKNVRIYALDITKRKEIEKAFEEAQLLLIQTTKMATMGLLGSSIAHEISNPLTGVLSNVQMLKVEAREKHLVDAESLRLMDAVEDSANRCKNIIQSLLSFAAAPRGKFQPQQLNVLIDKALFLLEREFYNNNIALVKLYKQDIPDIVGDSQLLQQVIFDLAVNAIWAVRKEHPAGEGRVTVTTDYDGRNKQVVFGISDNGIGIAKENVDKIFTAFFTTKPSGSGTGLGLAIAADIIKSHEAEIFVDSSGKGSIFTIRFPVRG